MVVSEFDPGHGFVNWFPTGTVHTDTDEPLFGAASLRLTSAGDGSPVAAEMQLPHAVDLRQVGFQLWVRADDPLALSELWLQATGDDWANYVTFPLEERLTPTDADRWLQVAALDSTARREGTADTPLVDRVRLRVNDRGGGPATVHVDRLSLVRKRATGAVSITFDDGWANQYEHAFPIMERFGFDGTAFIVPYLIGSEHYMTEDMLHELYDAGWDVGGHYHPSLRGREDPELGYILRSVHEYLVERGFDRSSRLFAYPQGYFDQPVLVPAVSRHFGVGRTIVQGLEALPPADPMRLRSFTVLPETTPGQVQEVVEAARRDRAWLILVFHRFTPAPAHPTEVAPGVFEEMLARIGASGLPVLPVSQVVNGRDPARQER